VDDPPVVQVDVRERGSETPRALEAAGAQVVFRTLAAGDYRIGRDLLVERKSGWDFRRSLFDGRLFRQMARLSRAAPRPLLLLEGPERALAWPTLRGALLSITGVFGIPVLFSRDAADSAQWILAAARQQAARPERAYVRPGWRPKGKRARQIFVLQGLPGVGPRRAEALLDRFGSVRAALQAGEAELREVPGIGRKTAARIVWLAT
jgi:Fanconi anemia group M protein